MRYLPGCTSLSSTRDVLEHIVLPGGRARIPSVLLDAKCLDGTPHAPATANPALTALRGVLREAAQLGLMTFAEEVRTCQVKAIPGRRLPAGRMLSPDELTRLFFNCGTDPRPAGARDAALLAVLALCGPRRSERIALDLSDYDADAGTLRVRSGKGNKERVLVGNAQTGQALVEWLEVRGLTPGPLFLPLTKGGKLCWWRLTDKSVSWILRVWAEQAVVNDFGPHDMRRTCISNLLDSGADVVTVADLVVIPCWASPHDLRSVGVVVDLCKKGGKPYVMVLNAVTAARRRP